MREEAMPCSTSGNKSRTCFWARCIRFGKRNRWVNFEMGPGSKARRTYPVISNFVGPDQLAIETEVHPFRDYARLQGSGVPVVCVDAAGVCSGGCIGIVGANRGGPVHAVPPWVWIVDR